MYSDGSINVSYNGHNNDNIQVYCKNSSQTYYGTVKPSCEGYITFDNKEEKAFEFDQRNKEIVWSDPDAGEKWIRGCFY